MAINSGLIDDYWRSYRQKRVATGLPMSYNETMGLIDAGLSDQRQMFGMLNQQRMAQEQLDLQKQQMKNAEKAANISGIVDIGKTAGNLYLGNKLIGAIGGGAGAGAAGVTGGAAAAGAANEALLSGGVASTTSHLIPSASAAGTTGSAASMASMAGPLAAGAGLYLAQNKFAGLPAVRNFAHKIGLDYARKGFGIAGPLGAGVGLALDVGKKVEKLLKKIF